jgi:hypothetical protein
VNHTVRLALDRSVRSYDSDGRLRVATAVLTRACVSPYLGAEVPNYQALGLSASPVYQLLRPERELRAALSGFNGLPILTRHVPVSADDHRGDLVVGSTGSSAALVNGEVANSLTIWAAPGIDLIESGAARSLSCGYAYTPVMQSGSFQGRPYDIEMRNIKPNHVALVAEPRVAGAMVGDAMPRAKFRRSVNMDDDNDTDAGLGKILEFLESIISPDDLEIVQALWGGAADVDEAREQQAIGRRDDDRRSGRQAADSARRRPMSDAAEAIYARMFPNNGRLA